MLPLREFIRQLPKAELHLHIEGTLEPELMLALARRNGMTLRYESLEQLRAAYQFSDLQSFLDIYYEGAAVLRHLQDFYEMAMAYFRKAASQNVRHVEPFFDPQTHTVRGVSFATLMRGLRMAQEEAEQTLGLTSRWILCFLRHLSEDEAMKTLQEALPFKEWIVAVGLDSGEKDNPPRKFGRVFARARSEGFLAVAHAGEEGPPEYIREALDLLRVRRIDHGVRCSEDPALVKRIVEEQIPLTVCPLSNVKLRVFKNLREHNLRQLLQQGVKVTLNSDDPAYFGGYINENYLAAAEALNLTHEELEQIAANSFDASFLDE